MKSTRTRYVLGILGGAIVLLLVAMFQRQAASRTQPPATDLVHSPGALAIHAPEIDPLPSDTDALLAGRRLYITHCAVCHGATGAGDELYAAQAGQPLPDLREHMVPGVHTDAQVFAYIKDGISGTSMPGYGLLLSEIELRQVAAYTRTFGQTNPMVGVDPDARATELARPPTPTPVPTVQEPLPKLAFIRDGSVWYSNNGPAQPLVSLGPNRFAQNPTFAPDGQRIAFTTIAFADDMATITATLQVSDLSGSDVQTVWQSTEVQLRHPTWSADGTTLTVTALRSEATPDGLYLQQYSILQVNPANNAVEPVLEHARDLSLHSDSAQLAYIRTEPETGAVSLIISDTARNNERVLITTGMFEEFAAPRFAPDGSSILFAARGDPVTNAGSAGVWLRTLLSPSVARAHGTPWDIWMINSDGSNLRRLTALYEDEPYAAFSPDGREIVMLGLSGIYRADNDGSRLRRIDPIGGYGGIDWAPR
jgi:Tol biopolymer transport system component/mono/diheme cytochrome c family protein